MRVRVLGQLTVTDDEGRTVGRPGDLPPRARQVLGVLAARHDRLLSKDSLADAIWGDRLPDKYGAALEHYVCVLRRRLEPGRPRADSFIVTRGGGYLFSTERAALDLAEVHRLVAEGDASPAATPARIALRRRLIDCADALPFAEDEYAAWAVGPRAEVREALLAAHVEVASAVAADDPQEALRLARRAIDLDHYAEPAYQLAMRATAAVGRPDEALRWFERCSRRLGEELGVGPSAQTSQLRDRIAADRVAARATPVGHADGGPTRRPPAPSRDPAAAAPVTQRPAGPAPVGRRDAVAAAGPAPAGRLRRDTRRPVPVPPARQPPGPAPEPVREPSPAPEPTTRGAPFFGRREEIGLLLAHPPVPLVHVVGPAGAGKSALLAELRRRAPERVGIGAAAGAGELRLSWLHTMLAQLRIGGAAGQAVDRAMAAGRLLTARELTGLVAAFDDRTAVVLAVDDAETLDERSVAELAWIARHCRAVCLTFALRCPARPIELPVGRLRGPVVLRLPPLTDVDLRGCDQPDAAESSGGIPALLAALRLPRRAALATAGQVVDLRTGALPDPARLLLRALAVLGATPVDRLARLTDLPLSDALRCIDQLLATELVAEGPGGQLRHRSELVRTALAEHVSGAHTGYLRQRLKTVGG